VQVRRGRRTSKVELLRGVSLFSACSHSELRRIGSLADEVDVPQGRVLTREGETGQEFFVVVDGEAEVSVGERSVGTLGPGSSFGEMSLFDQGPRSATVTALTDMRLLVLDARSFAALIREVPSVALKIFRAMAQRLRAADTAAAH
jgi:CRP/FNR family transcriptional regulator, cyclic AMP receptor protein